MKRTLITASAAAVLLLQGTAGAQQQTETGAEQEPAEGLPATRHQQQTVEELTTERFQELDQDGDGQISPEEAQGEGRLAENWERLDQDGNGRLSEQEVAALGQHSGHSAGGETVAGADPQSETESEVPVTRHQAQTVQGDLLNDLDKDGDGRVSQQEAEGQAQLSDNWDQLDQNSDGVLDAQELDRFDEIAEIEEAE